MLIDLSHVIHDGLMTYPGLPAPRITPHLTREQSRAVYAPGTEFAIDSIEMVGNTGTYLDAPFHRFADGDDLADLPLEGLVGLPASVVHMVPGAGRAVTAELFDGLPIAGHAVLLHTGWDEHFGIPHYGAKAPYLHPLACDLLVEQGAALVGIDSVNIDDTDSGGERPIHTRLLAAGIPIVEHLTGLQRLPASGSRFTAVPPRIRGFGTFPVRAFAETP